MAIDHVLSGFEQRGRNPCTVHPQALVWAYADALNAEPSPPIAELGRTYSDMMVRESPVLVNPEAIRLVEALAVRDIPVISITNTYCLEASWQAYLRDKTPLKFQHVITSCEVGQAKPHPEIFREAARRLGVTPAEMLHVGDRWELDVEGAFRAGSGAVLYRGLWQFYPEGAYPQTDLQLPKTRGVRCIDHLEELLDGNLMD